MTRPSIRAIMVIVCALSRNKLKAAIKRAQRKFTCKLHSEREQVQSYEVRLKRKGEIGKLKIKL